MNALVTERVDQLRATVVDDRYKGIPLGTSLPLAEIGSRGWNVARGDLALPVTTLRESALRNNLAVMADYCRQHGALLAPHGKTTMAPQLFERQLAAGAWGLTAATPTQAAVMRRFGIDRIILANQIVEPDALRWTARQLADLGDGVEIISLVDDPNAVRNADAVLAEAAPPKPLPVLIEVGVAGGRAGVRDQDCGVAVAQAVAAAKHLTLVGIEIYEGLATSGVGPDDLAAVDAALVQVADLAVEIDKRGLFEADTIMITGGGSAYFDRVVGVLGADAGLASPTQLVLRSGCYLTHDLGKYHRVSPFDGRAGVDSPTLVNALDGWARVLSVPEPNLAILGTGKRDLPYDVDPPCPLALHRNGSSSAVQNLAGRTEIVKMMDQHAFMRWTGALPIAPGDIVRLGMSHPCTAFDKTRFVPIIDDSDKVIDAVLTFF